MPPSLVTPLFGEGGIYALTSGGRGEQPAAADGDVRAIVPRGTAAVLLPACLIAYKLHF